MRPVRIVGFFLLWLSGVVLVAALSWVAINSAGRQVVDQTVSTGQVDAGQGGADVPSPGTPTATRTTPPTTGLGPAVVTSSPRRTGGTAIGTPAPPTGGGVPHSAPITAATTTDPPRTAAAVVPVQDSETTAGGAVWIECTGPAVTDYVVQPSDAWQAHHDHHGTGDLEVTFTRSTARIDIRVTCVGGRPSFAVSSTSVGHDD